jgi:hypothetical protein
MRRNVVLTSRRITEQKATVFDNRGSDEAHRDVQSGQRIDGYRRRAAAHGFILQTHAGPRASGDAMARPPWSSLPVNLGCGQGSPKAVGTLAL